MDKFQIAATVDRLIYGDEKTFLAADASALLDVAPIKSWRRLIPNVSLSGSGFGRSAQGFAAGFGSISMRDQGANFDLDARGAVRIGQWKLYSGWRTIEIQQVSSDSHDELRCAKIRFSFRWIPIRMDILIRIPLLVGSKLRVSREKYHPWKTPI